MKYITVKLTEDQIKYLQEFLILNAPQDMQAEEFAFYKRVYNKLLA